MPNEADDNATTEGVGSPGTEGSETTPEGTGTQAPDELALARRRQAGADAARTTAERQRDDLAKELAALKAGTQTQEATDAATLKEQLRLANETIAKAAADKTSAVLDVKFPAARAKFPAITDEVQLAELEGFYGEPAEAGAPTPRQHNANKTTTQAAPQAKTANDIEAEILAMELPTN